MSWTEYREELQTIARTFDPSIILLPKSHWFWRCFSWLIPIFTFGVSKRERFLTEFATTCGPIWGIPDEWARETVIHLIPHEGMHTFQARLCGACVPILGLSKTLQPWIGVPLQMFLYCLFPLPIGLSYFRYRTELDADKVKWECKLLSPEIFGEPNIDINVQQRPLSIAGPDYFYAWPLKWVQEGYRKAAEEVKAKYAS